MKLRKIEANETIQADDTSSPQWTELADGTQEPVGGLKQVPAFCVGLTAVDAGLKIGTSCLWRRLKDEETDRTPRQEAERALVCLNLEAPESVAYDVKKKVMTALDDFATARATMIRHFREDPDLWRSYRDNLAMLAHDKWDVTDKADRDEVALEIMQLLFETPEKKSLDGEGVSP